MGSYDDQFSAWVRRERNARDVSQAELARQLTTAGVPAHATTIAKIEAGTRTVKLEEALAIAELFDLDLRGLFRKPGSYKGQFEQRLTTLRGVILESIEKLIEVSDRLHEASERVEEASPGVADLRTVTEAMEDKQLGFLIVAGSQMVSADLYKSATTLRKLADLFAADPAVIRAAVDVIISDFEPNHALQAVRAGLDSVTAGELDESDAQ